MYEYQQLPYSTVATVQYCSQKSELGTRNSELGSRNSELGSRPATTSNYHVRCTSPYCTLKQLARHATVPGTVPVKRSVCPCALVRPRVPYVSRVCPGSPRCLFVPVWRVCVPAPPPPRCLFTVKSKKTHRGEPRHTRDRYRGNGERSRDEIPHMTVMAMSDAYGVNMNGQSCTGHTRNPVLLFD